MGHTGVAHVPGQPRATHPRKHKPHGPPNGKTLAAHVLFVSDRRIPHGLGKLH